MARGRAANYDEQREMILAKAAHLFAHGGYPGTSMNQVAQATGLSKATLYHYFRDKYSLLVDIAEGHVSRLEALVAAVDAQALTPEAKMRALIARIMAEYAHAQDAHRVLTSDVRFLEPVDRKRILGKERCVVEAFADAIAAWQPAQQKAALTKPLTMLLFGMINWMFTWMRPGGALTHEALAPIVTDLFFGGVPAVGAPAKNKAVRKRIAVTVRADEIPH
ncbi:MAG: TetR/AcrR family transcriptional regulator [Burkholderiaceae bacterium]